MSLINKLKEALGITAMEVAQAEARKEAAADRKAAAERGERMLKLIERMAQPQHPAPMQPTSGREAELINQIAGLQAEVKQLQEERERTSKEAIDAFLASLSAKVEETKGKVGRPRKDGTKVTLRIDAQSWAAVEYLRQFLPRWKFTEFCNDAVRDRLDDLFAQDARLEAGFNLWMQSRLEETKSDENDPEKTV